MSELHFDRARVDALLEALTVMAGGDLKRHVPISPARDELDAVAHAVNVLAGELVYRMRELQDAQAVLVQSAKMAALGEVSAGLAHELNNPLAVLRGYGELTRELVDDHKAGRPLDTDAATRYLERMDAHVVRMSAIISHIKEFSRQSAHARETLSINEVVERSFVLLNEQLRLRAIRIRRELARRLPPVEGDALRLEQVLINLLTNARDAITDAHGDDGGTIRVRTRRLRDGTVEIAVADDGAGMTDEIQQEIFTPFFTTKAAGKGTGLGLSIAHGIVAEHGGRMRCVSEIGRGTEMIIQLPGHA